MERKPRDRYLIKVIQITVMMTEQLPNFLAIDLISTPHAYLKYPDFTMQFYFHAFSFWDSCLVRTGRRKNTEDGKNNEDLRKNVLFWGLNNLTPTFWDHFQIYPEIINPKGNSSRGKNIEYLSNSYTLDIKRRLNTWRKS
jgi:hypothetical protein